MATRLLPVFLFSLISFNQIFAQNQTQVREFQINKKESDTEYRYTFVHLSDIHIGEGIDDYGTVGFRDDTMPQGDVGYSAESLRNAVNWINSHIESEDIRFVVITGDITGSGERSEFEKAKEIFDELEVPYVPIIGNHDVWPYVRYEFEAEYAYGDSVMNEVFKDTYLKNSQFFDYWDEGMRLTKVYSPKSKQSHNFHNFSFAYDGFVFVTVDFNPRHHVEKAEPGVGGYAVLNNFENGSYPWLLDQVENHPLKEYKNIVLLSHQPPHRDALSWYNGLPLSDIDKLTKDLLPFRDNIAVWIAGHVHRNAEYVLSTIGGGMKITDVKETAANKDYEKGYLSLIRVHKVPVATSVKTANSPELIRIYPNPAQDLLRINSGNLKISEYQITDSKGQTVSASYALPHSSDIQVNISNLPDGIYQLLLNTDSGDFHKSFIVVK